MKILVASDLHGDIVYTKLLLTKMREENFDKLYLLGDLKRDSIEILNPLHEKIVAVCGNCDGEEEDEIARFQMPLINYDYMFHHVIVLSHGHRYSPYSYDLPYDIFLTGHTHISGIYQDSKGCIRANPGSISEPRDGYHSVMVITEEKLEVIDINTNAVLHSLKLER